MRVSKIIYFLLVAIAVIAGILWYVGRDERAIKKVIREVASYASSEAGKSDIANALSANNLANNFTETATIKWRWPEWPKIKTGEETLEGREKMNPLVSRLRRMNGVTRTVTLVAI